MKLRPRLTNEEIKARLVLTVGIGLTVVFVMSIGFMLPDPDEAVIWRGPRKNGLIKQFLRRSDEEVVLHQFNPARDISLKAGEVKRIYRITGAGEAG